MRATTVPWPLPSCLWVGWADVQSCPPIQAVPSENDCTDHEGKLAHATSLLGPAGLVGHLRLTAEQVARVHPMIGKRRDAASSPARRLKRPRWRIAGGSNPRPRLTCKTPGSTPTIGRSRTGTTWASQRKPARGGRGGVHRGAARRRTDHSDVRHQHRPTRHRAAAAGPRGVSSARRCPAASGVLSGGIGSPLPGPKAAVGHATPTAVGRWAAVRRGPTSGRRRSTAPSARPRPGRPAPTPTTRRGRPGRRPGRP
jgi:hypothetical protein